ncbi:HlyU family transcriptional regulator [Yoonia sp.]|uniref:HlyU family transcriptional regulator n=1 Tax=Yoonia sp. TaxID=2212373 RepID=UPI002FDB0BAB
MAWFSKLFGGAQSDAPPPEDYKGFAITPQPQKDAGGWRISALIEKGGKSHTMIRADVLNSEEAAMTASVGKARQVIDEQGERIFG